MAELIDRAALLAEYDRVHVGKPGGARALIANAPAVDAVEAVRCKDCKHMGSHPNWRWCNVWRAINGMGDEGFCNYGERRNDG